MKNLYDKNNNLTEEGVARMLANPFYCIEISPSVIGAHPPMISEEDFIKAGVQAIKEKGAEAYIKNILENLKGNYA